MTALTRIDPREDLFREFLPDLFRSLRMADWPLARRVSDEIKLNVVENDKEYLAKAEIPGAKKEDIQINVAGNYVSISAEVKEEKEETRKGNGERTLLRELRYGSFTRGFTLPQEVDQKKTCAKFENGVLSITLPKREPAAGIAVSVQ